MRTVAEDAPTVVAHRWLRANVTRRVATHRARMAFARGARSLSHFLFPSMSLQSNEVSEWVIDDNGRWQPVARNEQVRAWTEELRERCLRIKQECAASRALCEDVRRQARATRAWHSAPSTAVT